MQTIYQLVHPSWHKLKFWDYYNNSNLPLLTDNHILPPLAARFRAFLQPKEHVKVVILGQDPYPRRGLAHGLAFSVQPHIKTLPPSLRNIFKELQDDLGIPKPRSGDLRPWAERGVLLLNTILTVEEGKPLSHKGLGWEKLAYEVCRMLSNDVVFCLWGKAAQEFTAACNGPVVACPHPSPLAKGFLGSKPFSQVNGLLERLGREPIDWRL